MSYVQLVYGLAVGIDLYEELPEHLAWDEGVLYLRETERVAPLISFNLGDLTVPYPAIQNLRSYVKKKGWEWSKPKWFVFVSED